MKFGGDAMTLNMGKPIAVIAVGLILALIGISGCADNPITSTGRAESGEDHEEHGDDEGGEGGAGRLVADEEGRQQLTLDQCYD